MQKFSYNALDRQGESHYGEMEAMSEQAVLDRLVKQGLMPVEVSRGGPSLLAALNKPLFEGNRLSNKKLLDFTRNLSTLVGAGLSLERSLATMNSMGSDKRLKRIVEMLLGEIREGASLATAMKARQKVFPGFYISMVSAGEASGTLDVVLARLTTYLERRVEIQEKVSSALVYPALLLMMVVVTMVLLITVVLPQFRPIFEQAGDKLPLATKVVMGFGDFMHDHGLLVLLGLVGLVVLTVALLRQEKYSIMLHRFWLKIPLLGGLLQKGEFARFHRMLGTLLQNGIPLTSAFVIARDGIANLYIFDYLGKVITRLREGGSLSTEYGKASFVPAIARELTRVGEDTGRLDEMLLKTADILEEDVKNLTDRLMALLVPLLTLGMGLIIAGMIAAVMLGILSINEIAY